MSGRVASIHIAEEKGVPLTSVPEVRALPGRGLEGDRYCLGEGTFSKARGGGRDVTLIEKEAIEAIAHESDIHIEVGEARRNIVTEGVALNHLVGKSFRVGDVTLRGIRLCEPCGHLEDMTKPGVREALIHRGGLRAEIVSEGTLRVGAPVETS